MPQTQNPKRQDEDNEFSLTGPFGGIQSEAPPERIETFGFLDAKNIFFRKGLAMTRPELYFFDAMTAPFTDAVVGIADFFDVKGDRHQVVITPTELWEWQSGTWVEITGTLTGGPLDYYSWTVVNNLLLFDQGVDVVQSWDGMASSFGPVSGDAVPARYLFELNFHLMALYTIEGGNAATQRLRWTAAGDPTDWTSPDAGQEDLLNDLGPVTGGCKLYQSGFAFQYFGITQIVPTGIGIAPWQLIPMGAKCKGNVIPYSLATFGEEMACYVGKNNIYSFDGNYSVPIGDMRIDGSSYARGARKRILADLLACNFDTVSGYISTTINANDYQSYWLFMPELKQAWVYHFDEQSWTRETFAATPTVAGDFYKNQIPRIKDLVGQILAQEWSPATLVGGSPFDDMLIGFADDTLAYMDFTGTSEIGWTITSGSLVFGDYKHKHTVDSIRLVFIDNQADFTCQLTLSNNKGLSQTQTIGPVGTGSGLPLTVIVPFQPSISGVYLQWVLSGDAGQQLTLTEITPNYNTGGEVRAGTVDQ